MNGQQSADCRHCGFKGNYLAAGGCPDCGSQNVVIRA